MAPGYVSFTREEWLRRPGPGRPGPGRPVAPGGDDVFPSVAGLVAERVTGAGATTPFLVAVAGGVAVGKTTTARILQALLAGSPGHPAVDRVSTDGFLLPNAELHARGLAARKGFPESYDVGRLLQFLADVKAGRPEVTAPVYSHDTYDIVPGRLDTFRRPDILLVEGLNVLQGGMAAMFDFGVYVDAAEADMERWYVERFVALRDSVATRPGSFYQRFAGLRGDDLAGLARMVWRDINAVNLAEHIAPTRCRADLILEKGPDHAVAQVRLRRP